MLNKNTCLLCLSTLLASSGLIAEDTLRIAGSDLLKSVLEPHLKNWADNEKLSLQTQFYGTLPARTRLETGDFDLAIIALTGTKPPDESRFQSIPLAFEVVRVYVNEANPIAEISIPQLAGIFGASAESNFNRWNEIGVAGAFGGRSIQPLALRQTQGVGIELFKHIALRGGNMKVQTHYLSSQERLLETVRSDVGAIAIASLSGRSNNIKILPISKGGGEDFAFGPTMDNVYYGDYPIRLPFHLVFPSDKKAKVIPLIRFLLGSDVRAALVEEGFIPLPENIVRRTLQELDIPR